jgi:hypothetical protein
MTSGPVSKGLPDNVTGWYELAGMVTEMGFESNAAPEVLRKPYIFLPQLSKLGEAHLRLKL